MGALVPGSCCRVLQGGAEQRKIYYCRSVGNGAAIWKLSVEMVCGGGRRVEAVVGWIGIVE